MSEDGIIERDAMIEEVSDEGLETLGAEKGVPTYGGGCMPTLMCTIGHCR